MVGLDAGGNAVSLVVRMMVCKLDVGVGCDVCMEVC